MTALRRAVAAGWAVLSVPTESPMASFPLDVMCHGRNVMLALDNAGLRHLLVPVGDENVRADGTPSVLGAGVRVLAFADDAASYVDISCAEPALNTEFSEVIVDVVEEIAEQQLPAAASLTAIGRWRRLFRSRFVNRLSHEEKLGLFAELTVLQALAEMGTTISAWVGPDRQPHDFELLSRCVEVKALGSQADSVVIHGLEQLAPHGERDLDLLILTVREDPDGETLADLVGAIANAIPAEERARYRAALSQAGWRQASVETDFEFFVAEDLLRVEVTQDVPRLVSAALKTGLVPDGITSVNYRISIQALQPFATYPDLGELCARIAK